MSHIIDTLASSEHTQKKWLGLLGLGNRSTLFYIDQLNIQYNQRMGGYSTCPFLLLNSDFNQFNPYLPNQFSVLEKNLSRHINQCFQLPIDRLIIPNITLHECYDRLDSNSLPKTHIVVHPILSTMNILQQKQCKKIVLFGSAYTMQSATLHQQLIKKGIEVIIPSKKDIITIDSIRKVIYTNQESAEHIQQFSNMIKQYQSQATIVLACSELSIAAHFGLIKETIKTSKQNVYDMVEIQIQEALAAML